MGALAVGIDLGTTNSCVAIYRNGKVEILQNDENSYVTPSWVGFTENGIITGHEAKNEVYKNISNTVFEVKRLMGQRYDDQKVQDDIKRFPYKVINDHGMPKIKVAYQGKEEEYLPEEVSAFILQKLKGLAEARLGQKVNQVVVTVPAYFNDFQRQATKDAAVIAGFQKVNVINEPTAAALAFSYHHVKPYKRNIMVYDFGGGTFDVSIVTVGRGKCEVKATSGDSHLGGADINVNLVDFIKTNFKKQYGEEIEEDDITTRRLRTRCEKLKEQLSGKFIAGIELDNLSGKDYVTSVTRLQFEDINKDLFEKTINIVKECLTSSGFNKTEIDEVVLVGGSSRIPKVQELLKDYFGEDKLNKGVNPDEAVAYGAAIHATNLLGNKCEVEDVISLSLGISVLNYGSGEGYLNHKIVLRNTSIPVKTSMQYHTSHDEQEAVSIIVNQGESDFASENFELGNFVLSGLRKAPAGSTKFDVCFEIDFEGILNVTASEVGANNVESIEIDVKRKGLTAEQVISRKAEMVKHREEELRRRKFFVARHNLEKLCYTVIEKAGTIEDSGVKASIVDRCDDISSWLYTISLSAQNELEQKQKELENMYSVAISEKKNPQHC